MGKKYIVDKEKFIDYYFNQNHSRSETAKHFNIPEHVVKWRASEFGCKKTPEKYASRTVETRRARYGEKYFEKDITKPKLKPEKYDKIKSLLLDGKVYIEIENELNVNRKDIIFVVREIFDTKEKREEFRKKCISYSARNLSTNTREKLSIASKNTWKNEEHIKKVLSKWDENGGSPFERMWKNSSEQELEQIKKRISEGTKKYMESRSEEEIEEFKETCRKAYYEKAVKTNLERYGVEHTFLTQENIDKIRKNIVSKINKEWFEKLNGDILEFPLKRYSYDIKKDNYLIEINPTHTHNSTFNIFQGKNPLPKEYHYNKRKFAEENGYKNFIIWDWDDENKIISFFKDKMKIFARNCQIKEIDKNKANLFLNEYHFQNACKGNQINLGLFYKDILVEVMTFGKPRYNKNFEWELLRLCSHKDYLVIGGANKLFNFFLREYNPKSIISYCDNDKFDGNVYKKLNFIEKSFTIGKHWHNPKNNSHITDNLLRMQGADRIFGTNFGKGTSNNEIALSLGYLEVYDSGQSRYEWFSEVTR